MWCCVGWAWSVWCRCDGRWCGSLCWYAVQQHCRHGQCIWGRLPESELHQVPERSSSVDMWLGVDRKVDMCRSDSSCYCLIPACFACFARMPICHLQGELTGRFSLTLGVLGATPPLPSYGHETLYLVCLHILWEYDRHCILSVGYER